MAFIPNGMSWIVCPPPYKLLGPEEWNTLAGLSHVPTAGAWEESKAHD